MKTLISFAGQTVSRYIKGCTNQIHLDMMAPIVHRFKEVYATHPNVNHHYARLIIDLRNKRAELHNQALNTNK